MDLMQALYAFGKDVADALNRNEVRPPSNGVMGAVLVVASPEEGGQKILAQPPMGGSLNYDKELKRWMWTDQLEQAQPIAAEDEQG